MEIVHYVAFDEDGREIQRGSCRRGDEDKQCPHTYLVIGAETRRNLYYEGGEVKIIPDKPSEHHWFDYSSKTWVEERNPAKEWEKIRQKRDYLLGNSDWTQLPDVPESVQVSWREYRQQLRDITLQPDPFNLKWPENQET